ncbi:MULTISPECIES: DUF6088 family protein [Pseudomonas]|uniref:DUF6088 family protein n=1 Tax=Pseudomonas TaxID=286 RepID=UPI0007611992|nr:MULTISPECIES: DUF6088 family protein [Pseudomonas]MBI6919495.1 type IV toxin-antitoxin system AbiEi family antitoxin domain-containing protein [Pseudomonas monteilii]MBM3112332.1 type IV toxin-antitoxin system AbiEi family antitoxin domain-containing protein [Pseudomonas arcuscaelestis]MCE0939372.1 type IV toxin-antitoxin system AbiEi family antitoxin domain-containing protein [Pseudomonas kurunegalensis]MCE0971588.1 type IV toxin-antitoxin system AbiEi family antitoxin domain-containing pro
MSVAESIAKRVKRMSRGRPFTKALFAEEGSRTSVNKALSRMARSGLLERVARGIYMRPKISEYTGRKVRANPITVMETVVKASGETIQIHGVEAVRRLGLSTQMQVLPTYYTSGSTREIKMGNAVVRLRHSSWQRLQQAGTQAGLALTALFYLGKEGVTDQVTGKILCLLSAEEYSKLMACKMPKWMRKVLAGFSRE